jgi:hypothetical protein
MLGKNSGLWDWRLANSGSVFGKGKRFLLSPRHLDWLSGPPRRL